jgi:hypothetical protein
MQQRGLPVRNLAGNPRSVVDGHVYPGPVFLPVIAWKGMQPGKKRLMEDSNGKN